jgi:hypothetical protein
VRQTLADRLSDEDAERFVGRGTEVALFDALLAGDGSANVVLLHGPGGIGKSALLREIARRAAAHGWSPLTLDARELTPASGELEAIFAAAAEETRPVVLVDTYEQASAHDALLRRELLPALPAQSIVVLAGREPPGSGWYADGWEHLVRTVELGPLTATEGEALVLATGDVNEGTAEALVRWSAGSPLALTLATEVARQEGSWDGRGFEERPELVERLVRRLLRVRAEDEQVDVLAVAAIARVTTAAMLAEVLPQADPNEAYGWLRAQAITEPLGDGLAMHELVRRAVGRHLKTTRPERDRELRRRIADHLFARAAAGEPRLMVDLAELMEASALRWAFGAEGAGAMHADSARPGELERIPAAMEARGSADWWASTRKLAAESPEHLVVARDADDVLCGLAIAFTPDNASAAALADPLAGGWIRHARDHVPDGNALIWRDCLDLTNPEQGDLTSRVLAMVNTAAILRSGLVNPRFFYVPINPINLASVAFAADSGSRHLPELDVHVGDLRHECHVIDYGPDGLLGSQRDTVYAETGAPRSRAGSLPSGPAVTRADVHQALRDLDRPSELAVSPLAAAVGGADPAAAVRALLVRAADQAFGAGPVEALLRDVVERAYVDHRTSHEQAAHDLHVSRPTYFRRLRQATGRVSDHVLATLAAGERAGAAPGSAQARV